MPDVVIVGRTHRPCGVCAALVAIAEGCRHMPLKRPPSSRSRRVVQRERNERSMVDRSELLGALGYPKP